MFFYHNIAILEPPDIPSFETEVNEVAGVLQQSPGAFPSDNEYNADEDDSDDECSSGKYPPESILKNRKILHTLYIIAS